MKVFIGKYKNWFGPHQLTDLILRPIIGEERAFEVGSYLRKTWLFNLSNQIYNLRKRKIKVRIDPYDTWGMDHTLSLIIAPMLKQLKETKHGSPWVDNEDVPEELRSTNAPPLTEDDVNTGATDENFHKRWDWVMDELIWVFEEIKNEDSDVRFYKNNVFDRDGYQAYCDRKGRALRLFGKYFEALWD